MTGILAETPKEVGIAIRRALIHDLPRVMEIEHLAFEKHWDYYQFKASLDDIFLVAVAATRADIVGFLIACCCDISQRSIILRVAVHPDCRRQGIATQLLEESFPALKEEGMDQVELDVDILTAGAIRLYEKVGFKVVEIFSPSEEEDETFIIMRKRLG